MAKEAGLVLPSIAGVGDGPVVSPGVTLVLGAAVVAVLNPIEGEDADES
jgi:hypothetical protein